jgi:DNA-binding transcriptional ArsR family regulator
MSQEEVSQALKKIYYAGLWDSMRNIFDNRKYIGKISEAQFTLRRINYFNRNSYPIVISGTIIEQQEGGCIVNLSIKAHWTAMIVIVLVTLIFLVLLLIVLVTGENYVVLSIPISFLVILILVNSYYYVSNASRAIADIQRAIEATELTSDL